MIFLQIIMFYECVRIINS